MVEARLCLLHLREIGLKYRGFDEIKCFVDVDVLMQTCVVLSA